MPVIEAPARSEDEALALVYDKVSHRRRHRQRLGRRSAAGVLAALGATLVWLVVAASPAQHRAVYAVPASLTQAQSHQVVMRLTERYRAVGYGDAHAAIAGGKASVEWEGHSAPGADVVSQLGDSGSLSLRPVLSTVSGPCAGADPNPAPSSPTEALSPTAPGQCLQLGPAQMTNLVFASTAAVRFSGGWAVRFTVAPQDVAGFDQVNAASLGRSLAIVEDGQVLSAPVVHDASYHGQGMISGRFDEARARALAVALRYGLPASLPVISAD